jgi:hypothetical protein
MRAFLAYLRGEPRVSGMLHVPAVEDEDRKRRDRERLLKERTARTVTGTVPMRGRFGLRLLNLRGRSF